MKSTFEHSWCCCGKPMEIGCHGTIPDDFFEDMDIGTAFSIHKLEQYINLFPKEINYELKQRQDELTIIFEHITITVHSKDLHTKHISGKSEFCKQFCSKTFYQS